MSTLNNGLQNSEPGTAKRGDAPGSLSAEDYLAMDATTMAEQVRSGDLDPEALLDAALARCDAVDGAVNSVVMRHEARARALLQQRRHQAGERQGLLAGVPMLIKDLNTYVAGTVTTHGSRLWADAPPAERDSTLVARYEAAGMLIFGKTASPEFGLTTTTESSQWGKTCNPWNLAYSAGGSSGGAAAAVASGIIPVAHATDGGGSIRIPASYCGVFGLKPTRYRTPQGPYGFEAWFGASCSHVVSRSVRDSALLLDVSHGHEHGSPYWLAEPDARFGEYVGRTPERLRIGLVSRSMTGIPLDPDIQRVLDETIALLLSLGHLVESVDLPIDPGLMFSAHGAISTVSLLSAIDDRESAIGRAVTEADLEPITRHLIRNARNVTAQSLYRSRRTFESIGSAMEQLLEKHDLLLSPVTATATPKLDDLSLQNSYEHYIQAMVGSIGFTVLANVSGQPAMSVPLGTGTNGLPIGMMFTAAHCREGLLFQLAGQLEQARPWASRRAPL